MRATAGPGRAPWRRRVRDPEQREKALGVLAELRALGVKLSIDDFGTGYSSLAYLTTLPFDCLKIDRSFVIGMHESAQNVEIVRTILSLGRTLNKHVIAEGIETQDQLDRLRQLGAPIGQGYLLSRPLAPYQAAELLLELTSTCAGVAQSTSASAAGSHR